MRLLPLAALFLCGGLVAACGGQTADRSESAAIAPDHRMDRGGDTVTDDAPVRLAMTDDVLRIALERADSYLPVEVPLTDQSAVIVSDLLYDGLTEAVGNQERLRPGLAQAWWPNEDYTAWTFSLDPDAGVDPQSVVNSLLPFAAEAVADQAGPGVAARLAAGIRTVSATSSGKIVVELAQPNAGLPWVLSGLPFSVVGPGGQPTGSYRIASDDAAGMRLANRLAGSAADVRPVRIEWKTDRMAGYQKLIDGKLDGALVPTARVDEASNAFAVGPTASVSTRFYVLHLGSDRLADPAVRDLVRSAIDRSALAVGTFEQDVVAADGLMPDTMAGHRPDPCPVCDGETPGAADPQILSAAGPLEVAYSGSDQQATARELVSQLVAAGIAAVEQPMEPEELAAVIVSGGTDIFSFGWVAAATSSDATLPVLLSAESPANVARIGSPEIDRILAAAAVTADDQARWDLHHQAHEAALSSGRLIPVAAARTSLALSEGAGAVAVRADGSIDLECDG